MLDQWKGTKKIAVYLALLALAVHLFIVFSPFSYLVDKLFFHDDTFYPLTIARNIATGSGSTLDGIHSTNAYQPLLTLLSVPLFLLFSNSDLLPVYIIFGFLALVNLGNGYFIYRLIYLISKQKNFGLLGFAIWTLSFPILQWVLNGLETALSVFLFLLVLFFYLNQLFKEDRLPSSRFLIGLGFLSGIAVLARIDNLFLFSVLFLHLILRYWRARHIRMSQFLLRLGSFVLGVVVLVSPWLLYNLFVFGDLLPNAVAGYRVLAPIGQGVDPTSIPLSFYGFTLWQAIKLLFVVSPFFGFLRVVGASPPEWLGVILVMLIGVVGIVLTRFLRKRLEQEVKMRLRHFLTLFGWYTPLLVLSYSFILLATFFFPRYFTPLLALMIVSGSILVGYFFFHPRLLKTKIAIAALAFTMMAYPYVFSEVKLGYSFDEKIPAIEAVVRPEERIGVFQAGMLSYFSNRTVVNLDGKLNPSVLPYIKQKRLYEYLIEEHITYIGDRESMLKQFWPTLGLENPEAQLTLVISEGDYRLYRLQTSSDKNVNKSETVK